MDEVHRARSRELSWRRVGDEAVILDLVTQTYLSLNATGLTVWTLLQEGATRRQLADGLVAEHGASPEDAERDAAAFLDVLRERDLLA